MTEQAVMDAVDNLRSQKTIIVIAHRLSTIEGCDKVFVFEGGKLVDEGPYEVLQQYSGVKQQGE
jgi:ABC-type multidrug transport system fused ATPase/permease subunit